VMRRWAFIAVLLAVALVIGFGRRQWALPISFALRCPGIGVNANMEMWDEGWYKRAESPIWGTSMKQLSASVVVSFVGVLAVMCQNANAQMQMRQPMPVAPQTYMIPQGFVTEDQWINSIVDRWTVSQRKSWRLLDRRFSGWASHLVWLRKVAGRPSGEVTVQAPHLPSACPVDSFAAPTHSLAESMNHFREVMPDVDWNAWANIEPTFRAIAEWEMSAEHYRAQVLKTLKDWWALHNEAVRGCLNANALGEAERPQTAIAAVSMPRSPPNLRYAQIDRRVRSEQSAIDHMVAPEPIKTEAREQISDAAAADRYAADVDEHRP